MHPSASLPQTQPACLTDTAPTGLIDCGNWAVSASWTVPATAVSGMYIAHLVRDDTGGGSQILFVVRNDASHSDLVFQTSDATWQAYNTYGGNSLYSCTVNCPPGSPEAYKGAYKVTYNRPFHTALDDSGRSWFMYSRVPDGPLPRGQRLRRQLHQRRRHRPPGGSLLLNHKIFMSVGHDEYWSGDQRANVEAASDAGVNLAFFSGNEVFWKTRLGAEHRRLEHAVPHAGHLQGDPRRRSDRPAGSTHLDGELGAIRASARRPTAGGRRTRSPGSCSWSTPARLTSQVPAQYSKLRFWRNTAVANLSRRPDGHARSGNRHPRLRVGRGRRQRLPACRADRHVIDDRVRGADAFIDYGSNDGAGTATHHLTLYRAPSGALVFGAGTVQWSWGLDSANPSGKAPIPTMQQATVNLLADMGAQPATLISGLIAATASTDTTPPTSTITSPSPGASVRGRHRGHRHRHGDRRGRRRGRRRRGVDRRRHDLAPARPAPTNWTYTWVAHGNPSTTIQSRAVDDSGNLETPSIGHSVNVNCPCSIWGTDTTPASLDSGDAGSIEVGVKFTTDIFGTVTGIRFYKATANTGHAHRQPVDRRAASCSAQRDVHGETASGWQQVNFAQPVPINPNTTYVASYFAPKGHYAQDEGYFYPPPSAGA